MTTKPELKAKPTESPVEHVKQLHTKGLGDSNELYRDNGHTDKQE